MTIFISQLCVIQHVKHVTKINKKEKYSHKNKYWVKMILLKSLKTEYFSYKMPYEMHLGKMITDEILTQWFEE